MHAVVIQVEIASDRWEEAEATLHEFVVPTTKAAHGFVRGTWMHNRDKATGIGVVLFENAEQAKAMVSEMEQAPPRGDDPVTMTSVELFDVAAEA
jgi:hypothetical protein